MGRFISFEGGEAAGKSTQIDRLGRALRGAGYEVVSTREPGGTPGAEAVRHVVLSGGARPFGSLAEAAMFASARADHLDSVIRPALSRGAVVLCDRFADSSRVYQRRSGRVVEDLQRIAVRETWPHLTLIMDVPVDIAKLRIARRGESADRFERERAEEFEERRQGFLALAEAEPQRCVVLDGTSSIDEIEASVRRTVAERLGLEIDDRASAYV